MSTNAVPWVRVTIAYSRPVFGSVQPQMSFRLPPPIVATRQEALEVDAVARERAGHAVGARLVAERLLRHLAALGHLGAVHHERAALVGGVGDLVGVDLDEVRAAGLLDEDPLRARPGVRRVADQRALLVVDPEVEVVGLVLPGDLHLDAAVRGLPVRGIDVDRQLEVVADRVVGGEAGVGELRLADVVVLAVPARHRLVVETVPSEGSAAPAVMAIAPPMRPGRARRPPRPTEPTNASCSRQPPSSAPHCPYRRGVGRIGGKG